MNFKIKLNLILSICLLSIHINNCQNPITLLKSLFANETSVLDYEKEILKELNLNETDINDFNSKSEIDKEESIDNDELLHYYLNKDNLNETDDDTIVNDKAETIFDHEFIEKLSTYENIEPLYIDEYTEDEKELEKNIYSAIKRPMTMNKILTVDGYYLAAWRFYKNEKDKEKEKERLLLNHFFKQTNKNNTNNDYSANNNTTNGNSYNDLIKKMLNKNSTGFRCQKKPVIFQHGFLDSSFSWLALKERSLVNILVEHDFDVWLVNNRGNVFSTGHIDPSFDAYDVTSNYWNFTYHEMSKYDIPSSIEFILEFTKHQKVSFIGHSQGSFNFFLAYVLNPEYITKTVEKYISIGTVFTLFNTVSQD